MVNLVSPGVSVSVTDESFYVGAGEGTVPVLFIATRENKSTPDGGAIAPGTLKGNANQLFLISSQRELLQTFGSPDFRSVGGTALNGNVLNEYGLLAAHSFLGVSNRAFVMRADVDLAQLEPRVLPPTSDPEDLTYWTDLNRLSVGLFESDGNSWSPAEVTVFAGVITEGLSTPASGFVDGDIVLAADSDGKFSLYRRVSGAWAALAVDHVSPHTEVPGVGDAGDLWFKTTSPNQGADVTVRLFDGDLSRFVDAGTVRFAEDSGDFYAQFFAGDATVVPAGTLAALYDDDPAGFSYSLFWHNGESRVRVVGSEFEIAGSGNITINGTVVPLDAAVQDSVELVVAEINNAGIANVVASVVSGWLSIEHTQGQDLDIDITGVSGLGIDSGVYSNLVLISEAAPAYVADFDEPVGGPLAGSLWYDPSFIVDLLIRNGNDWAEIDSVQVQPGAPTERADGSPLQDNDIWVRTLSTAQYPEVYRWRAGIVNDWVLVDNSDQTTPNGIIFADARPQPGDALDADAPDPLLYPSGMLLWNTRYSGRNVKQWVPDWQFQGQLIGDRWVSVSGTELDGTLITGQAAVRRVVADQITAAISDNDEIRADSLFFNLLAAPGFPEVTDSLVALNIDRRETGFVIADTPFDLGDSATELQQYAQSLTVSNENVAYYYPSALTNNLDGTEVVVPASHMMLRTFAFNDQVSFPWFAPAGFQRGRVTNARAVGYLDSEDEFVPVNLNQGQRDVLYLNNINPITTFPGRGIVVMGQKTRLPVDSALDRVNVARLINFIRFESERIAEPFLFEPNDTQTRAAVKDRFDSFLSELVTLRGVFDFLVVVDESNNTPARIDRNELYIDIAISPTKTAEFIYIPIRVRNTGADLSL